MTIFAQPIIGLLNAAHGIVGFVLFVALIMAATFTFAVGASNWKHITIAGTVASASYLVMFALGWVIYPVAAIESRPTLEVTHPAVAGLLDIKLDLSVVAAAVALGLLLLGVFGRMRTASSFRRQLYGSLLASLGTLTAAVYVIAFVIGAYR